MIDNLSEKKDIKQNEAFTRLNVKSIRPCYGIHPKYLKEILNKKASKDIKAGTRLSEDLIYNFKINN